MIPEDIEWNEAGTFGIHGKHTDVEAEEWNVWADRDQKPHIHAGTFPFRETCVQFIQNGVPLELSLRAITQADHSDM